MMTDWFEGLDHDLDSAPTKAAAEKQTFPCESCGGTGQYRGARIHQPKAHCFVCKGRGSFTTSAAVRRKAKQQRQVRKDRNVDANIQAIKDAHPGLLEWLFENGSWSSFAADMFHAASTERGLSDKQINACVNMRAKCEVRQAERTVERAKADANRETVDVSQIERLFETALQNGLSRRAFKTDRLTVKPAGPNSKWAGSLYVVDTEEYAGRITDGKWFPVRQCATDVLDLLNELAADPSTVARQYGQRTGKCCCCGRELTNPASIEDGIGPICASKWGL